MQLLRSVVCAFVAGLTTLCAVASASAEPLKIGYSDWPGWVAFDVAIQKGFFKEAGVDVEMVWFEYGPSMEAFGANKIDAVAVTNSDAMVTGASGRKSTAIFLNDYSNGNDMVIGKPGINSIKDLKGKKIGLELNLVEHLLFLKALETNGMKESDVTITNFATNETPQALASGGVDAVVAWYPVSGQALKQVPGSKSLFTSKDVPGLIYDGLYVGRDSLAARKADWMKVAKVWFKTVEYIKDPKTRDDAIKIMAARVNVKPEDYAKSVDGTFLLDLQGNLKALKDGDGLDSVFGSSKTANAFNVKNGVYKESQDIKSYVTDEFVKAIAGEKK